MSAIRYEKDADNVVILTLDAPNQSANTMNADFRDSYGEVVSKIEADIDNIAGVIFTSAKKTFFAGGDLNELIKAKPEDSEAFMAMLGVILGPMRKLETLGKPVVAAINGAALGGGWELCLACHYRIALADPKIKLGLPEVTLGLLPGGGGTVRMTRLLGIEKALPFLIEGKQFNPDKGLELGLINELAANADDLINRAKAWIKGNPKVAQPWDEKGYKMPGGTPQHPKVAQMLSIAPAMLKNKTFGCYPAPEAIMSCVVEGAQVDFDIAQRIESRYFTSLATGQVSKNMIGTFWFQLNAIKAGNSRPKDFAQTQAKKVGVLGAGMMGAGIAYACATRGIDVVLKDVSQDNANKGKAYSEDLLKKKVSRKRLSEESMTETLARITATDSNDALDGCDLIIEAVFEDKNLKHKVTQETEPKLVENGYFASNTSTIPITSLATASQDASKFIGLHFFSPVDKMQLVEIILGKETSDETLAKAFDFVLQINKVPIVVNDSRGFFTSRVFGTFVNEGIAMLGEGVHPASIENGARQAGMPVGPLAVSDEVSLNLMDHVRNQSKKDVEAEGGTWNPHPAEAVMDAMLKDYKRAGKAAGGGFYDYPDKGKKALWPELNNIYVKMDQKIPLQDIKDRILFIQAIETVRCMEENVLMSVKDANIGSIFGIGFAPWTGGAIQFINQYGVREFVERAKYLAEHYGERFTPPALLLEKAEKGELFD